MNNLARYLLPAGVVALAVIYVVSVAAPPTDAPGEMHLYQFGRLPIYDEAGGGGGRVKPFDTVARNNLMLISERQTFTDEAGNTQPAIKWLLDVMTSQLSRDGTAEKEKVFRIDNDQLLSMLKLEERPGSYRYAVEEFADRENIKKILTRARAAQEREASERDLVDEKTIKLAEHLQIYENLAELGSPYAVPPQSAGDQWKPLLQAVSEEKEGGRENPASRSVATLLLAYARHDPAAFNRELDTYSDRLKSKMPSAVRRADFEVFFNHFAPFYHTCLLFAAVFLLSCCSWLVFRRPLRNAALGLLLVTIVVHGFGLLARMYLMDRPLVFVINLYSSAVFIGWVAAITCVVLELIFRNSVGTAAAGVIGFATAVIAHNLAAGDTIETMRAVLDTNLWLATHVTCVTFGYAATFLAGLLGVGMVLYALGCSLVKAKMDRNVFVSLGWMIYGVACFATLLSFTGTVLGGIWADQSWGRFWGWDPKENGALLIVIWNALILHARWAGMVKQRGVAVLAVFGNIVTAWSWFGVNMLGVGLHNYGFMHGAVFWILLWIGLNLGVIVLGVLPLPAWKQLTPLTKELPRPETPLPRVRTDSHLVPASR
jgi:ABC-type transport system involved in cytochrome c biogenesis permease subunit